MKDNVHRWWSRGILAAALIGIASGIAAHALGRDQFASLAWTLGTLPALAKLIGSIARDLMRGRLGVDLIAVLAMAYALILGQPLAAIVIAAMYATGIALEDFAVGRAERELSSLARRTPRTVHLMKDSQLVDYAVERVRVGDRLMVNGGEVVAVDGKVSSGVAVMDEAAITGESLPVTRHRNQPVTSGTVNAGQAFEMITTATAQTSIYAHIVDLAKTAQASRTGLVRLADRYALFLLPLTLLASAAAWWLSGNPVRALAVLVVATPCPLILAVPVAFVSGISRAASRGILVKGAGALEAMARATVLVFDKTGTLTVGGAQVSGIDPAPGWTKDDLLRIVASLDQASSHVVAKALVESAKARELELSSPSNVHEKLGAGIEGLVQGRRVRVGSLRYVFGFDGVPAWARAADRRAAWQSALSVFATVDHQLAGVILLTDEIRLETPRAIRALRRSGISRITMVTGDRNDVAETIAAALDVDAVLAERVPEDKVDAVREERKHGITIMVGDGINDAPALAAADAGIAMGARGATASSETADAVILVDRLDRVAEAVVIAQRTRRIALQSATVGMALSAIAMGFAAAGLIAPVAGALLQEVIDAVTIANSLRTLIPQRRSVRRKMSEDMSKALHREHRSLSAQYDVLRDTAAQLADAPPTDRIALIQKVAAIVNEQIVPHERNDERLIYPRLDHLTGDRYMSSAMGRAHREILHLCRLLSLMARDATRDTPDDLFIHDMQRILLSLEAIGRLHSAQEDEVYDTLGTASSP